MVLEIFESFKLFLLKVLRAFRGEKHLKYHFGIGIDVMGPFCNPFKNKAKNSKKS